MKDKTLMKLYRRTMTGYQLIGKDGRIVGYAIRLLGTKTGYYRTASSNNDNHLTFMQACILASSFASYCGLDLDYIISTFPSEVKRKVKCVCHFYTPATIRDDYHYIFGTTDNEDRKTSGYFEAGLSDKQIAAWGYRKVQ